MTAVKTIGSSQNILFIPDSYIATSKIQATVLQNRLRVKIAIKWQFASRDGFVKAVKTIASGQKKFFTSDS